MVLLHVIGLLCDKRYLLFGCVVVCDQVLSLLCGLGVNYTVTFQPDEFIQLNLWLIYGLGEGHVHGVVLSENHLFIWLIIGS